MINFKKNTLIFLVVLAQSIMAIAGGFIALYIAGANRISPATFVDAVHIGSLTKSQAVEELKAVYGDWASKQKITIKVEGETRDFEIQLKDIDAVVDYDATVKHINDEHEAQSFYRMINSYFLVRKAVFSPSVSFSEEKLREKIKVISSIIYKDPVNARIYLRDGKVQKVPGADGRRLSIDNAVARMKSDLAKGYKQSILFSFSNNSELEKIEPEARTEDLEGVEEIIASYSTEIKAAENLDSIKAAVSAINKVLIYSVDPVSGERAGVFSFNKYLNDANLIREYNDEGYNQVASTLHAAVITAGIEPKDISRIQHKIPVDYIEPGLDVRVFGSTEDYKFRNSLDNNIVIFSELKDNKIIVSLAGKSEKKKKS